MSENNENNFYETSSSDDNSNNSSIINIDENKLIDNFYDWLVDKSLNSDEKEEHYRLMLRDPVNDILYITYNIFDIYKNKVFFGNKYSVLIKVNELLLNLYDEFSNNTYRWISSVVKHYLYDSDDIDLNNIDYVSINNEDIFNYFFDDNYYNQIYLCQINLDIIKV
jgi:hypothetical protein